MARLPFQDIAAPRVYYATTVDVEEEGSRLVIVILLSNEFLSYGVI
jgi:hypothetical protein